MLPKSLTHLDPQLVTAPEIRATLTQIKNIFTLHIESRIRMSECQTQACWATVPICSLNSLVLELSKTASNFKVKKHYRNYHHHHHHHPVVFLGSISDSTTPTRALGTTHQIPKPIPKPFCRVQNKFKISLK